LRCTNAHPQEWRSSARRGCVIRTLCRDNLAMFGSWRTHIRAFHGGLRPPLLVARADTVADGRFSPTRVAMVPRNSGSSPGSEAGFVRFSPRRAILFPRGAYAPRSWLHVRMPLQMGDFRRGERYGGVAAASALVHWVEDGQFSPRSERCFSRGWLRLPAPNVPCAVAAKAT
jgi:hypothetical protein